MEEEEKKREAKLFFVRGEENTTRALDTFAKKTSPLTKHRIHSTFARDSPSLWSNDSKTMSITPLDLVPGDSLGPFQLGEIESIDPRLLARSLLSLPTGSLLFNVLNHVRSYRQAYPSAKLLWDDEVCRSSPSPLSNHVGVSSHLPLLPLSLP